MWVFPPVGSTQSQGLMNSSGYALTMSENREKDAATAREIALVVTVLALAGVVWLVLASL